MFLFLFKQLIICLLQSQVKHPVLRCVCQLLFLYFSFQIRFTKDLALTKRTFVFIAIKCRCNRNNQRMLMTAGCILR